jgi:hypothetical protein
MANEYRRWTGIVSLLLVLGLLVGCGKPTESLEEQAEATIAAGLPTPMELSTPTSMSGANATSDPSLAGLPAGLSGFELLAARLGTAVYTGYLCSYIAEPGCVCNDAVIQQVTFTFTTQDEMTYSFSGAGYAAEWPMERQGQNQWGYTFLQGASEAGTPPSGSPGDFFYLLEFTEDGYILTQGANVGVKAVSCPPITFRRMMSSTPAP